MISNNYFTTTLILSALLIIVKYGLKTLQSKNKNFENTDNTLKKYSGINRRNFKIEIDPTHVHADLDSNNQHEPAINYIDNCYYIVLEDSRELYETFPPELPFIDGDLAKRKADATEWFYRRKKILQTKRLYKGDYVNHDYPPYKIELYLVDVKNNIKNEYLIIDQFGKEITENALIEASLLKDN